MASLNLPTLPPYFQKNKRATSDTPSMRHIWVPMLSPPPTHTEWALTFQLIGKFLNFFLQFTPMDYIIEKNRKIKKPIPGKERLLDVGLFWNWRSKKFRRYVSSISLRVLNTRPINGFNYIKDIFKFQVVMFYNFNINSAAYGVRAIRCIFSVFKRENTAPGQTPGRIRYKNTYVP